MADSGGYQGLAVNAANKYGVPQDLFLAQINQESGFNPAAQNGNATGIAQFMPGTAANFGIDPTDPAQSLDAAAKYDSQLYAKGGSWDYAMSHYGTVPSTGPINSGQANVEAIAQGYDNGSGGMGGSNPSGISNVTINGAPQGGSTGNVLTPQASAALEKAAQETATQEGLPYSPGDGVASYNSYTADQQAQIRSALQNVTGSNPVIQGPTGNPQGGILSGMPLTETGTLDEVYSGTLNTKTSIAGPVNTVVNTSNPGGIAGLATQGETFIGRWFVRLAFIMLGLIIVAVALTMFKPVQKAVLTTAKAVA